MTRDRLWQVAAGAAVAGAVCGFGGSPGAAFVGAAMAGIAKEVWDAGGRGRVERLDALATAGGGLIVAIAAHLA